MYPFCCFISTTVLPKIFCFDHSPKTLSRVFKLSTNINYVCFTVCFCKFHGELSSHFFGFLMIRDGAISHLSLSGPLIFHGKKSKIARDFQGQIRGKIGRFRGILAGKSQNLRNNRPISQDFNAKKSIFEGFSGANS